jgi:hypothetical protein
MNALTRPASDTPPALTSAQRAYIARKRTTLLAALKIGLDQLRRGEISTRSITEIKREARAQHGRE